MSYTFLCDANAGPGNALGEPGPVLAWDTEMRHTRQAISNFSPSGVSWPPEAPSPGKLKVTLGFGRKQ